ncbi:MAG: hypothetical protein K2Z80_20780 [Xanthobacteraceae bacterium]|nr:hypothetical protein [Xanthobacteraceae bacterium]
MRLSAGIDAPSTEHAQLRRTLVSQHHLVHAHCRAGDYKSALEVANGLDAASRTKILHAALRRFLASHATFRFFGLFREIERFGLVDKSIDALYARAFALPILPKTPSGPRLPAPRRGARARLVFNVKWPEFPLDFRAGVGLLEQFRKPDIVSEVILNYLYQANGIADDNKEAYKGAVLWGAVAELLYLDMAAILSANGSEWIRKLQADRLDELSADVGAATKAGRSVLMVGAHAGLFRLGVDLIQRAFPNAIRVGAHALPSDDAAISLKENPEAVLYQIVKKLRGNGNVVLIGGDGPYGTGKYSINLFGSDVDFRLGAPFAAFHAKCQPIWYYLGWSGGRLAFDYALGPVVRPGEKYEDWLARWFEFYAGQLRRIITGDPRNIRGRGGGLWWLSGQSLKESAGKSKLDG